MSDRFLKIYKQGVVNVVEIWIDKETGITYLAMFSNGWGGGLTPLLDAEGKPIITKYREWPNG